MFSGLRPVLRTACWRTPLILQYYWGLWWVLTPGQWSYLFDTSWIGQLWFVHSQSSQEDYYYSLSGQKKAHPSVVLIRYSERISILSVDVPRSPVPVRLTSHNPRTLNVLRRKYLNTYANLVSACMVHIFKAQSLVRVNLRYIINWGLPHLKVNACQHTRKQNNYIL